MNVVFLLVLFTTAFAQQPPVLSLVEKKADKFFEWLNQDESTFTSCQITQKGDWVTLCDQTQISFKEIKKLFSKNPFQIIAELKKKKIKFEVVCDVKSNRKQNSEVPCVDEATNPTFKKLSSLHGLYVAEENKIFIKSTATAGVVIHEYLHYLQSQNRNKVNGHIYKLEKNRLKKDLERELDILMVEIKQLEKENKKDQLKTPLNQFIKLNNYMMAFGKWQDLIDERSLFLLYQKYEKDFSISATDMALVHKNLRYVCERKDLQGKLSEQECPSMTNEIKE